MQDIFFNTSDLAPGDSFAEAFDHSRLDVHLILSQVDTLFEPAYEFLWNYFGPADEMESVEVLARRFALNRAAMGDGAMMRYELMVVRSAGEIVGACDQTAIADGNGAVVHSSHVLVSPLWRRSGLGGWLRAFPLQTARRCLRDGGLPPEIPISIVAEMEYPGGLDPNRYIRLKAYERAGFLKIDPSMVDYYQPDFRPPALIDETGGPKPLPFQLIVRRMGRENATCINGAEVRMMVERLYKIYSRDFRAGDMAPLWQQLEQYPSAETLIRLIPPSE